MRRYFLMFKNMGLWKYIPLLGIISIPVWHYYLAEIAQEFYVGAYINLFVGNVLSVFAAAWPILLLQDVLASPSGELYMHWKRNVFWWVAQVTLLMLLYALPTFGVATLFIRQYSTIGVGLAVRYFLFCMMYAWFGFVLMFYIKEKIWALFACLLYLLIFSFGRLIQLFEWNPYHVDANNYFYQVSSSHTKVTLFWIGISIFFFVLGFTFRKRKGFFIKKH